MKRIFFIISFLIIFFQTLVSPALAEIEPVKVMSLKYDDSSSIIYINTKNNTELNSQPPIKYSRFNNPNRIYFDINDAILIGDKQQLVFEKSDIKEIRLGQFETEPRNIVRAVITFEEDFDTSKAKLFSLDGDIIVQTKTPKLSNDYFNEVYDDIPQDQPYSSITANSQVLQKVTIPVSNQISTPNNIMDDIQRAFENTTLSNATGNTYDSTVSVDLSSNLKLRTKYFINQYSAKNNGLLVSGIGQLSTTKMFYLDSPDRAVIDLPNTFLDKKIRNTEINLCPDNSCKDSAKIGQFEHNVARIVITSDQAEKYIPIYSQDAQSLFLINSDKFNHTAIVNNVSNINKAFVKRIDTKTGEMILSFTSPVAYSIIRKNDSLNIYLFNVRSYNEQDLIRTLANTPFKKFTFSLLPQIGVRGCIDINKNDEVKVEQSVDGKAMKITIKKAQAEDKTSQKVIKKGATKNKIVLDAGHGGSDYGAIREGINEKDITFDVTQRVNAILRSKGYLTALTRSDDTFVSLEDRVEFSEKEAPQIFVSIHVNSAVSKDPNGIETHYYHEESKELAEIIHKHMTKEFPKSNDRGLFKSKFYVINHTTVPAILCEIGFLSNDAERNELITDSRKQRTAKAIAAGIMEYLRKAK